MSQTPQGTCPKCKRPWGACICGYNPNPDPPYPDLPPIKPAPLPPAPPKDPDKK